MYCKNVNKNLKNKSINNYKINGIIIIYMLLWNLSHICIYLSVAFCNVVVLNMWPPHHWAF